jgi:hypothetical protein
MDNKEFKDFINKLRRIDDNILVSIELWNDDIHGGNYDYIVFSLKELICNENEVLSITVDFKNDKVGLGLLIGQGEFEGIINNYFFDNSEKLNLVKEYLNLIENNYNIIKESFR